MNDFIAADSRISRPSSFHGTFGWIALLMPLRVWVDGPDYWVYFEMNEKYIQICRL
jgi:hypothetical protein